MKGPGSLTDRPSEIRLFPNPSRKSHPSEHSIGFSAATKAVKTRQTKAPSYRLASRAAPRAHWRRRHRQKHPIKRSGVAGWRLRAKGGVGGGLWKTRGRGGWRALPAGVGGPWRAAGQWSGGGHPHAAKGHRGRKKGRSVAAGWVGDSGQAVGMHAARRLRAIST